MKNSLDIAREEGFEKGLIQVIQNGLKQRLSVEVLATLTNLSTEEIHQIIANLSAQDDQLETLVLELTKTG